MKNVSSKKITREWIEITLCEMVDDIVALKKAGKNSEDGMKLIKKYAKEIYNAQ